MPQEVKEAKMVWVQLRTKCKCTTGSLDKDDDEEEDDYKGNICQQEEGRSVDGTDNVIKEGHQHQH
eukprot:14355432-Ditylum_brightwellii.AAC.1